MKYLPLIWSGIWRKPGRTILIFLQVGVAFALFGVLQGMKTGVEHVVGQTRADLLLVHGNLSLIDPLPVGLITQMQALPGVKVVIPVEIFLGTYQKPSEKVGIVAVRPDADWLDAFTFKVSPQAAAALKARRTATLVRTELAAKYGWKIGDHIPFKTAAAQANGSTVWAFDVVGTYGDDDVGGGNNTILINYDYFDEGRLVGKGTVSHFNVAVNDPRQAVAVADAIDRHFANSANETKTESLRELAQSQMQSIGDLNFLIRAIVSAVLVALLFAVATMMMQSIRERTSELAVLKTLGFTDRAVFIFILAESTVIFVAAAVFGLLLAWIAFPLAARFVPGLSMPWEVVALGLGLAAVVAVISASIPAAQAARLNIVNALASR
ncbi:MAG TPA: FtsX-like permease family protein [Steroidobacteraceae bacterium]